MCLLGTLVTSGRVCVCVRVSAVCVCVCMCVCAGGAGIGKCVWAGNFGTCMGGVGVADLPLSCKTGTRFI